MLDTSHWVTLGYLGIALFIFISVLSKNLRLIYITGLSGSIYMVVAGFYEVFHAGENYLKIVNGAIAIFGIWLSYKYVTEGRKFKKEEARLMKLIEESKQKIDTMFWNLRN